MTTLSLLLAAAATMDVSPETLDSKRGYVLEFSATWCGPCQKVGPIVARLERGGYPIRKVDIEKEPQLARKYNVRSIPTFVLVVDGREKNRIVGATSESQIRQLLAQVPVRQKPKDTRVADSRSSPGGGAVVRGNLDASVPMEPQTKSNRPMSGSVRIRVKDESGTNFGSGTIIRSAPGRTLILTCGHIVRNLSSGATIETDFFSSNGPETFVAEMVVADQQSDLGILAIRTSDPLPVIRVAGQPAVKDEEVYSIGCGGGSEPTVQKLNVTSLNRYLGPDNIECTGVPVRGRSGGGLFNRGGDLIGVCIAADPKDKRGLYSGLKPIIQILKKLDDPDREMVGTGGDFQEPSPKQAGPQNSGSGAGTDQNPAGGRFNEPPTDTQYSTKEIAELAGQLDDAEVICIIRSRTKGHEGSRVVIINKASGKFVRYLTDEMRQTQTPRTAMRQTPSSANSQKAGGIQTALYSEPLQPGGTTETLPNVPAATGESRNSGHLLPSGYRLEYERFQR